MSKLSPTLSLAAIALALPAAAQAQNYADLPPLSPMSQAELRTIPADMRTAPVTAMQAGETVTTVNGVETITRTRRIPLTRGLDQQGPAPGPGQGRVQPAAVLVIAAAGALGLATPGWPAGPKTDSAATRKK